MSMSKLKKKSAQVINELFLKFKPCPHESAKAESAYILSPCDVSSWTHPSTLIHCDLHLHSQNGLNVIPLHSWNVIVAIL